MPNRAERRRAEREKQKTDISGRNMDPKMLGAISNEVLRSIERKKARDEAILAATGPMIKSVYAAVILIMTEEYGFSQEQCVELLEKLEEKTLYCLDHQDILDETFEKTGIRISFRDGLDRISSTE